MEQKLAQLQVKLEADQSLGEKLFSLETPEAVQGLLKEQGIEFSLAEIDVFRKVLVKQLTKGETTELSDEALEEVAGGVIATTTIVGLAAGGASGLFGGGTFIHNITRGSW